MSRQGGRQPLADLPASGVVPSPLVPGRRQRVGNGATPCGPAQATSGLPESEACTSRISPVWPRTVVEETSDLAKKLHAVRRCSLPHLKVLRTPGLGDCYWHSLIRASTVREASAEEVTHLKRAVNTEVLRWAIGDPTSDLADDSNAENNLRVVSEARRLTLTRMGVEVQFSHKHVLTEVDLKRCLRNNVDSNRWTSVQMSAFSSLALRRNLLIWEPSGDGSSMKPYQNNSVNGFYLFEPHASIVHVLFSGGKNASGYLVRHTGTGTGPALSHNVDKCTHFEALVLPPAIDRRVRKELGLPSESAAPPPGVSNIGPSPDPGADLTLGESGNTHQVLSPVIDKPREKLGKEPGVRAGGAGHSPAGRRKRDRVLALGSVGPGGCQHVLRKGERKGQVCGKGLKKKRCADHRLTGSGGGGERSGKRARKGAVKGGAEHNDYDLGSDGELDAGDDDSPLAPEEDKKLETRVKNVPPKYQAPFRFVHGLHISPKLMKEEAAYVKQQSVHTRSPGEPGPGSAATTASPPYPATAKYNRDWSARGIPEKEHKALFDDLQSRINNDVDFTPTPSTLQHLPAVSVAGWESFWGDLHVTSKKAAARGHGSAVRTAVNFRGLRRGVEKRAGEVAFGALQSMWPPNVHQLVVDNTNTYERFCREDPRRTERHEAKKSTLGTQSWPEGGIDGDTLYGVLGILLTMGFTRLPRMKDHWSTSAFFDFKLIRQCMPRDMFMLIYCRFLHLAPSGEGGDDKLHHIGGLQDALNTAWSSAVVPGAKVTTDEMMTKETSRAGSDLQRFNNNKPIKHGVKRWSICTQGGLCLFTYVDGGGRGDPLLRDHANKELGRIPTMVLFILFEACPALKEHMEGSGRILVMDNYFCSPLLLLCLRQHNIYGVGTLRSERIGISGAERFWGRTGAQISARGDMRVAHTTDSRFPLQLVEWVDSKRVMIGSTVHIFDGDGDGVEYRRKEKGKGKEQTVLSQPKSRHYYNSHMAGVDINDQYSGTYESLHRPTGYFWRRLFDGSWIIAVVNSGFIIIWWLRETLRVCNEALQQMDVAGSRKPDDIATDGTAAGLTRHQLEAIRATSEALSKKERLWWIMALADKLMSKCQLGRLDGAVGNPKKDLTSKADGRWEQVLTCARACNVQGCPKMTKGACRCHMCTRLGANGAVICLGCFRNPSKHHRAAEDRATTSRRSNDGPTEVRPKRPIPWP